jgi:sarcosine oxidase subunit gamma
MEHTLRNMQHHALATGQPRSVSPLAHLTGELARAGGLGTARLRELPFLSHVELRLDRGELDEVLGRRAGEFLGCRLPPRGVVHGDGCPYVLWRGPGWYLVVDEPGTAAGLEAGLRQALGGDFGEVFGSVADISAQRTVLELSGPRAHELLQQGCLRDLHPGAFSLASCDLTVLAGIQVILHKTAELPAYRILVPASLADCVARWLLDAMADCARSRA